MSIPTIPDNYSKIILLVTFGIFFLAYNEYKSLANELELLNEKRSAAIDSSAIFEIRWTRDDLKTIDQAEDIALKFKSTNPLYLNDSGKIRINKEIFGKLEIDGVKEINGLLQKRVNNLILDRKSIDWYAKQIEYFSEMKKVTKYQLKIYDILMGVSVFVAFWAIFSLAKRSDHMDEIELRKNLALPRYYRLCQSCGREFNSIVKHGTESDGEKNFSFCESCYKKGRFVDEDLTAEDVIAIIEKDLGKRTSPKKLKIYVMGLERWAANKYGV